MSDNLLPQAMKGLENLFNGKVVKDINNSDNRLSTLSINLIIPGIWQPRTFFKPEELEDLKNSIKSKGILQPILVRKSEKRDNYNNCLYEIIAGERRWRAAKMAGLAQIPVVIGNFNNLEALANGLIENIQRHDLNPIEEARGFKKLIEEFNYTQEQLAKTVGKSRSYIANTIRLLKLPQMVQNALMHDEISYGHARSLLNSSLIKENFQKILKNKLNVRQTEQLVKNEKKAEVLHNPQENKNRTNAKNFSQSSDIEILEKSLFNHLNMDVKIILNRENCGEIRIKFNHMNELDKIANIFSSNEI